MGEKDKTEKAEKAPTTELKGASSEADPIAALRAEFAKQLADAVKTVEASAKMQISAAREEVMEAHDRISGLQRQLEQERAAPGPGGIGDALKELLSSLKSKDAQAADEHKEQKAKNHAKRVEIFEATKKNATHVFYKLHAKAYIHGVERDAGSIVSLPLHPEAPELHLPSIHWKPVVDRVVTTELVGADEVPEGRASDTDVA